MTPTLHFYLHTGRPTTDCAPTGRPTRSERTLWNASRISLLFLLIAMASGCDRSGDRLDPSTKSPNSNQLYVGTSISPRSTIDQCKRVYQQLSSYQDDGYVRLEYLLDGQLLEDRAPLTVAWDGSGRIGLRVYAVEAGPTDGRWRLRFRGDEEVAPRQVLSRTLPEHVDFPWLLSDPLVAERMSAGLAGFPPQLDLLLSDEPLSGLVDDSAALSFGALESIDGRACYVVNVQRGAATFGMWIDQETLMLRRLRLPRTHLMPQMLADKRVTDISLTIELDNIRVDSPIDWARFAVESTPDDIHVSRLVPSPLLVDTSGLGKRIPAFVLEAPNGSIIYSSAVRKSECKATVLVWLADHPACRVAAEQLSAISQSLEQSSELQGAIEFVSIWAEPQPPKGSTFESLAEQWKLPGQLALDRNAVGRDLFNIQEAPTWVIVDRDNRLQMREARSNPVLDQLLPSLLLRLARGEDLAAEMIASQSNLTVRHAAELHMAATVDSNSSPRPSTRAYDPVAFELGELSREHTTSAAIATTVDAGSKVWTLFENGSLRRRDITGENSSQFQTPWMPDRKLGGRIAVSPTSEHVAFCSQDGPILQLLDCSTQQNRTVDLGRGKHVCDFQWFSLNENSTARLAAITRDGQTVLLHPNDREQLSGRCPTEPVALLAPRDGNDAAGGYVVMADGSIESLQMADTSLSDSLGLKQGIAIAPSDPSLAGGGMRRGLAFQPGRGPWLTWGRGPRERTLARGWLARNEPALFMLDHQLNQLWHFRMPLEAGLTSSVISVANDPATGQPVWAVVSGSHTVHVLRGDGLVMDHFAVEEPVVGLALGADGDRLVLILVQPHESVNYELKWK